jgi:hypothetical protein
MAAPLKSVPRGILLRSRGDRNSLGAVQQAFVFEKLAVLVCTWREPMNPPERGARVEVRLLADEPWRGTRSAAQRVVIDQPVFRADLFDQVDGPPGNLRSAHFHPRFHGVEPCERHWRDEIRADPKGWLAGQLGDLRGLLEQSGGDGTDAPWLEKDATALREAVPAIVAAVDRAWEAARA